MQKYFVYCGKKRTSEHPQSIHCLLVNPYTSNQLISVGMNTSIKLWSLPKVNLYKQYNLKPKLSSILVIIALNNSFYLGTNKGQLLILNKQFQIKDQKPLHEDCLSDLVYNQQYLFSCGYDGKINILNKDTLTIIKTITVDYPLLKAQLYNDCIYFASIISYCYNLNTQSLAQIKRYDHFAIYNQKLYACSDDPGVTCISTNSNSYVSCSFMLSHQHKLLIFAQQCIGIYRCIDQPSWQCQRCQEISGYGINCGVINDNNIYLGGDQGIIHHIQMNNQTLNYRLFME